MKFSKAALREFLEVANNADVSCYGTRRELLDLWTEAYDLADGDIVISATLTVQLRSFLQLRSHCINDDNRLAFKTALMRLSELLDE